MLPHPPMASLDLQLTALLGPHRVLTSPDALLAWECDGFTVHRSRPRAVVVSLLFACILKK